MAVSKSKKAHGTASQETDVPGNSFRYEALDSPSSEIRLMKIHTSGNTIGIKLEHFELEDAPDYSALSYAWGDPTPTRQVMVNRRQFAIRVNLYKFLRVFQAKHLNEWLWVDQICIDQANTHEKNEQVQLMSDIYRNAFEVKIWLGPDNHPDERIFRERIRGVDSRRVLKQDSLEEFFSKPYWGRLWVLQEMLLARRRKIYYGYDTVDWSRFQDMCDPDHKESLVHAPDHIRWVSRRATSAKTILICDAVLHCTDNECEDKRDKIYGIQSLFDEDSRLQVNYAKSVADVFLDAVVMIAKAEVCTFDVGHREVCPDAPAECECLPLSEIEQVMLTIRQLAEAMDLEEDTAFEDGSSVQAAVERYRADGDGTARQGLTDTLRRSLGLTES